MHPEVAAKCKIILCFNVLNVLMLSLAVLQFCLIIMKIFEIKLLNVFKLVIMYKIMYNKMEAETSK